MQTGVMEGVELCSCSTRVRGGESRGTENRIVHSISVEHQEQKGPSDCPPQLQIELLTQVMQVMHTF